MLFRSIVAELREVDPTTGAITPKVVPFSRVVIPSADVNVNPTSPVATPIIFPSPVYVAEDKEYALVLLPGGVNPNYNVWTAVLGANDIVSGSRVTEQPATGFMFTSANQRIWVPVENEDLMFTAYYAEFANASPGNLIVKNEPRDYFTISDATGGFLKMGEVIHGETVLKGTFAPGSGLTGNVASSNSFVQGMVSGATGIITKVTTSEVRIRNVSTSAKFKGKEAVPAQSVSTPEMASLGPWWQEKIAKAVGLESVPAQARAWGAFAPQTGVETPIGAPKLELIAKQIMLTAKRLGVTPKTARDMVLMGKERMGLKEGGQPSDDVMRLELTKKAK